MTSPPRDVSTLRDAPRFAFGWAALVFAGATLLLAWPALTGGFLVTPASDQYIGGFPVREFAAAALKAGEGFPQWNPYIFAGMPYIAAMHGDIFYPTFLLRFALETDVAMTWSFIVHLFLAGLFTYGFLRAWGIGFFGSMIGGTAYMLSGPLASLVSPGHDGKLYVAALLPLTLWMAVRGIRDGRPWAWAVLALAVGLGVLSPHPQLLQYMLLAAGFFALYIAFARQNGVELPRGVALRRLGLAAAAVIVGFLIGGIQYVPVLEYIEWSPRAGGRGFEYSASFSKPPEEILGTLLPEFSGVLENYWGRNGFKLHGEYLGAAVLFLAGAAYGADARRRSFVWFWTVAGILALLWAVGSATPFFRLVYEIVPGTKFFRAPDNMFMDVAIAVAILAAVGFERIVQRGIGRGYVIGWGIVGLLLLLISVPGIYVAIAESLLRFPQYYQRVIANQPVVLLGALRVFAVMGVTIAAVLALQAGRVGAKAFGWGLLGLMAVEMWSVERRFWRFSAPAEVLYAPDPTIEYLQAHDRPGRVLALALSNQNLAYHDPYLTGDGLMVHDVRQLLGYHGNELGRFQAIGAAEQDWPNVFHPNFWQLYNVRWLLTNVPELPIDGARLVAGPARNAAGTMAYLYELPGEHPAAWVSPAIVKAPDETVRETLLDLRYDDVRRVALFDTSAAVPDQELSALPDPLGITARVTDFAPGRIAIELSQPAPEGSALVVSENYYPGWRAGVDGAPVVVARVNYTLIGVPLEPGARRIELRFESDSYRTGKTITLAALALVALAWGAGVLIERRRRG